jgi:hypothetical protein
MNQVFVLMVDWIMKVLLRALEDLKIEQITNMQLKVRVL